MAQAYAQQPCSESSDLETSLNGPAPAPAWRSRRALTTAALGLAGAAGAALLLLGAGSGSASGLQSFAADGAIGLSAEDPCAAFPYISLDKVLHSNLGGQGPDTGAEGLAYQCTDHVPGKDPAPLVMTMNASSHYKAGHVKYHGIYGKYGLITIAGGTEGEFTFRFFDGKTMKPKTLAKQELTFFDLDQHAENKNREYVEVKADQEWLTKNTEIEVTELPDGRKRFISTVQGSGSDNPKDPLALTVQQKNRAVTMQFTDFSELKITMGNTEGTGTRYFMFVARPSLLCARTTGHVAPGEDEVAVVQETTTAPPGSTTEDPHKDCLLVVPIIQFCVPKFF